MKIIVGVLILKKKNKKDIESDDELDVDEETNQVKGTFNKALPFLTHLQSLELICSEASINEDYIKWFDALLAWFNKLTGKLQKTDVALLNEIDNIFLSYEVFITDDRYPAVFKRRMLSYLQRKLEKVTDDFGYQMPEIGGLDEDGLDFS